MKTFADSSPNILRIEASGCHFDYTEAVEDKNYYDRGLTITLTSDADHLKNLSRTILKTDSCTVQLLELDIEMSPGKGRFSTIKDLLEEAYDGISSAVSNPAIHQVLANLSLVIKGHSKYTLLIDDPLGNSLIQCLPEGDSSNQKGLEVYNNDPYISYSTYTRTYSQEEEFDLPHIQKHHLADQGNGDNFQNLVKLIELSSRIVVLSGAGVSVESGIPAFRNDKHSVSSTVDDDSIWSKWDQEEQVYSKIMTQMNARINYWDMHVHMYNIINKAEPNASHFLVSKLNKMNKLHCVITQNIDGLYQKAGVPDHKIVEIHGSMHCIDCTKCKKKNLDVEKFQSEFLKDRIPPSCPECGGIVKHATISFGEPLNDVVIDKAKRVSSDCDLLIVMGTSLLVAPANKLPLYAIKNDTPLVIINLGETPLDKDCKVLINEKCAVICERLNSGLDNKM
ncbi:NAD-dependent protein deacylase [Acrasis kona]|uniref:NAD-dependent protein deacylase n=1 Tax=Acrasis kona TaxID=1008807 RepID=A0AAW2YNB4_9EUKA